MPEEIRANSPAVLMVDDEKKVADAYALRLEGVADVTLAYGGDEALALVDDGLVPDVVLLDRHMPDRSGDEVLATLRERDLSTRVVMVTAVDPGLGILDLPFDDYLCKPVERADLRAAVDQQCRVLAYELLGEYFEVAAKRAVVEAEFPADRLEDDEEFADLTERTRTLGERVSRLHPDADELLDTFAGIDREA